MNVLAGKISAVTVSKSLSLVRIEVGEFELSAIVIDTPETNPILKAGHPVRAIFKETEVILGSGSEHHISLQNKLPGTVQSIETGDLLSKVVIETSAGRVTSIITSNAVKQLGLSVGDAATAMVKTNEIMLSE